MSLIESAIIGYLAGFFVGSLIVLIIVGFVFVSATDYKVPKIIDNITSFLREYYQQDTGVFTVAFILGFLTGIGSSSKAAS